MPQLTQLPEIFWSQLFWLAVVFGTIFFGIGLGMLPKIRSTVARMDAARADAVKVANDAKQASARDTEAAVRAASEKINVKVDAAQAKIRKAVDSARAEIEAVAAEAAGEMVARLTGRTVDRKQAAEAVKAEMNV